METQSTAEERGVASILAQCHSRVPSTLSQVSDLLMWAYYGQNVLSQFGLGGRGYVFRQKVASVQMTAKVVEGDVPLVAFITSGTTTGCIEQMFDLMYNSRLRWQRDKFPWI